jgi:hypothetical protein
VGAIVRGGPCREFHAVHPVEQPEDVEMGETVDIGETGLQRLRDLEHAFGLVFRAETLGNLRCLRERGSDVSNRLY